MSEQTATTSEHLRCPATKVNGQPCTAHVVRNGRCVGHQENGLEARRKGGRNTSLKARAAKRLPEPISSLLDTLTLAVDEVHDGKISPSQGSSIASLVSVIVKSLEVADYGRRLESLEAALLKDGKR